MPPGHRERVLEAIRISSLPLDDDELSRRTSISPRQAVNQICRRLESEGLVRRVPGPDNKIVTLRSGRTTRPRRRRTSLRPVRATCW